MKQSVVSGRHRHHQPIGLRIGGPARLAADAGEPGQLHGPGARGCRGALCRRRDPDALARVLAGRTFDVVADFIAFTPDHVRRDMDLFDGRTGQYLFVSSASAYQETPGGAAHHRVHASGQSLLAVFRDKIACEEALNARMRETGFP